jgi:hypothetical protein
MPIIPALRKLMQEDREFEASLGYMKRLCVKRNQPNKQNPKQIFQTIREGKDYNIHYFFLLHPLIVSTFD